MDDLLQQGIAAYKSGKRDEARKVFIAVVKQSPDIESAWGWMYTVSNNDEERIHCLKQILRINPKNEKAKQMLDSLTGQDFPFNLSEETVSPLQKRIKNAPPVAQTKEPTSQYNQPQPQIQPTYSTPQMWACPHCQKEISVKAWKCPYCHSDLSLAVMMINPTYRVILIVTILITICFCWYIISPIGN